MKNAVLGQAGVCSALLFAFSLSSAAQEGLRDENLQASSVESVFTYGPFDFRPRLGGSAVYDDNILISHSNRLSDLVWTLSPGVKLGMGDRQEADKNLLMVEYVPSFIIFTDHRRNDAIDQDLRFQAQLQSGHWTLDLRQAYQVLSTPVIEVANRVDRSIYLTTLAAKCELSSKTTVGLDASQSINDYGSLISYNEWVAGTWLDFAVTPRIKIGPGINWGFVDVRRSANQTYQQTLVRVAYALSDKVEGRASAGGQLREFQRRSSDKLNGIFSLGATFKPVERTSLLLDGYRRDQNSLILLNQNYTVTGFSAGLHQSVAANFSLGLTGGYEFSDYTATSTGVDANRHDSYFFARPALTWNGSKQLAVSVFYQYRQNDSKVAAFDFSNQQGGVEISYRY